MNVVPENEIKDHESMIISENIKHEEITTDITENDNIISVTNQTNDKETLIEIKNNNNIDVVNTTESINENQKSIIEIENNLISNDNHDLESSPKNNLNDLELTKENNNDVVNLTKNENDDIEQLKELKNNDIIPLKVIENENVNLKMSKEITILDDAVKNNIQETEKYLQINGEISHINDENTEINDIIIGYHTESNEDDTETKNIEIQNNLNTLLSEDFILNTSEKENDEISKPINSEFNEDNIKENGNIVNQDSNSNSSDSETIINSECALHVVNGDNVENVEPIAVTPISVITIQTCDNVDSDCSEAYLTPNELNDTPKKVLEINNLNTNYVNFVNDNVPQLNPSIETNNHVEIPSNNLSKAIIEQKINEENINESKIEEVKENVKDIEDNIEEVEENKNHNKLCETADKITAEEANVTINVVQENIDAKNIVDIEENKIIGNYKENEIENKDNLNIVLQPHEESMFCPLIVYFYHIVKDIFVLKI